ncbi:hypothetical protein FG379_003299 [Cryptosporidium bovis]|uniref:uncharacterized protein n=1 Tax=Cryptosporidium bovis TaxID=310047 RepID=UPI00351A5A0A|nr:hypothetical protein FG379_003299 [Cryptosporidium bovis]
MKELQLNLNLNLKKDNSMLDKNVYFINNNIIENNIKLSTKIRPSILHSICSAFPVCKRTLIELVLNELFHEFVTKPDGIIEDAKYGICIPTLYSVLLLTVCHVHKLREYEEEWFEEFLKNNKFSFLTPSGCKTEVLFNLLNVLACFGSLKKRPANMQGVELVLLRLGISFYFSLCYIMDYPFSTNRIIKALISGAHEWIHGSQYYNNNHNDIDINNLINYKNLDIKISNYCDNYNSNKNSYFSRMNNTNNSNKFALKKISLSNKKDKILIQENTIKNLVGIFDDFTIKLICKYGYRPHCINWNDITLYIKEMNDLALLNLFKFTKNNSNFFDDNFLNEFIYLFNNITNENEKFSSLTGTVSNKSLLGNKHTDSSSDLFNYVSNNNNCNSLNEFKKIMNKDTYRESNNGECSEKYGFSNNISNLKNDKFLLYEFQDSDDQSDNYDEYCIDNAFNQEFIEKLYLSSHNKNNALNAISSKIKEMTSSKPAKLFSLNKLTKKQLNKFQVKNSTSSYIIKSNKIDNISKTKSHIDAANNEADVIYRANRDIVPKTFVKKPSWFGFSKLSDQLTTKQNNQNIAFKRTTINSLLNYITHKQQIYESEDNEDPLNVL